MRTKYSDIRITGSRFEDNYITGGLWIGIDLMYFQHSTVHIEGCTFPDNKAANHGLFTFSNCETTFSGNSI